MITMTLPDHNHCLRAGADPRATQDEREFLGYMAGLAAACEPVSKKDYLRMQVLTGGALSLEGSIYDRPHA